MTAQQIKIPPKATAAKAITILLTLLINAQRHDAKKITQAIAQQIKGGVLEKIIAGIASLLENPNMHNDMEKDNKTTYQTIIARHIAQALHAHRFTPRDKQHLAEIISDLTEAGQQNFVQILTQTMNIPEPLDPETQKAYEKSQKHMQERDFDRALEIMHRIPPQKRDKDIWMNMAMAATMEEEPVTMREAFEKAAELSPANPLILGQWGLGELFIGNVEDGLALYECRKWLSSVNHKTPSTKPEWNGAPFPAQTLFIYQELGFGDAMQFARYIPRIRERAYPNGTIILGCHPKIKPLFKMMPHIDQVVDFEAGNTPPEHDMHASLFSMPFIFDRNFDGMPIKKPYLDLAQEKNNQIQKTQKRNIGILWHSSTTGGIDKNIPTETLHSLKNAKNTQFFSLQFEKEKNQDIDNNPKLNFINTTLKPWTMNLLDLANTIHQLDTLITIDTAAAHIAGAMFKPAFLILPVDKRADWRWRKGLYKQSWYPSLTLIRQTKIKEWETPLKTIVEHINQDKKPKYTPS